MNKIKCLLLLLLVFFTPSLLAETVIGVNPNPIVPGNYVQFAVVSDGASLSKVKVTFESGRALNLVSKSNHLYTLEYVLPPTHPLGAHELTVSYIQEKKKKSFKHRYFVDSDKRDLDKEVSYRELRRLGGLSVTESGTKYDALLLTHNNLVKTYRTLAAKKNTLVKQLRTASTPEAKATVNGKLDTVRRAIVLNSEQVIQKRKEIINLIKRLTVEQEQYQTKLLLVDALQEDTITRLTVLGSSDNATAKKGLQKDFKEVSLGLVESEIASANRSLQVTKRFLSSRDKAAEKLESKLSKLQLNLTKLRNKESLVKTDLDELLELVASAEKKIADAKASLKTVKEAKEKKRLERSIRRIQGNQKSLLKKKAKLQKDLRYSAASIKTKEAQLKPALLKLNTQLADLEKKSQLINAKQRELDNYKDIRRDILVWMKKSMIESQDIIAQTNDSSTLEFDTSDSTQVTDKALKAKAYQLSVKNSTLERHNSELKKRLKKARKSNYKYAISPSVGIRIFNDSDNLENGKEAGLSVLANVSERFSVQGGMSLLSADDVSKSGIPDVTQFTFYKVGAVYDFNPGQRSRLVALTGFEGDIEAKKQPLSLYGGLGFKYFVFPDVVSKIELQFSHDLLTTFGFEKQLGIRRNGSSEEYSALDGYGSEKATLRFQIPQKRVHYGLSSVNFVDTKGHWGRDAIERVTALGMMHGENRNGDWHFDPNGIVSRADAAEMLVKAIYINDLYNTQKTPIRMILAGDPKQSYFLTLHVTHKQKGLIKEVLTETPVFAGSMTYDWDGTDTTGNKVPAGDYTITAILTSRGIDFNDRQAAGYKKRILDSVNKNVEIIESDVPVFQTDAKFVVTDLGERSSVYVNESLQLRLFHKIGIKTPTDNVTPISFEPDRPIQRAEFMVSVSRSLLQIGAMSSKAYIDFSPYKDSQNIPDNWKQDLGMYVVELGYGGDELKRIRPVDNLTRAEAATILDRLVNWQDDFQKMETGSSSSYFQ